jgi:hypothetical protein
MKKYITTYFYHDCEDLGASYGNIFLPLDKRNMIYWQTVYTLFFSSIVCNKNSGVGYVLFTNVATFPFRNEIEALGIKIYDDLKLTRRNASKWATVKFFFDVIDYIGRHQDFDDDDAFVMLDTDVVALSSVEPLFNYLQNQENAVAYVFDNAKNKDFHGVNISNLEEIGFSAYGTHAKIERLIGGEFFCFRKNQISAIDKSFDTINNSNHSNILTTEEQILTLAHAQKPWAIFPQAIYRVWTTLRVFKIPKNNNKFIFLHLPSEKEFGLNKLFNATKKIVPYNMTEFDFRLLFHQCIPLNRSYIIYLSKLIRRILG